MATETSTLAGSNVEARYLHAGNISISGSISSVQTASAGAVYRLCHLPKGAVITDCWVAGSIGTAAAGTVDIGVSSDTDVLIDGAAYSAAADITRMTLLKAVNYKTLTPTYLLATVATVSAGDTGGTLYFNVTYHMDNPG